MDTQESSLFPAKGLGEKEGRSESEHHTRPRPKSRLTSYLTSHRPITMPEKPDPDWCSLKMKDDVYVPDPEQMCNTLFQWYLANPGRDLPAGYSSFILHVLEDYRRVKMINQELCVHSHEEGKICEATAASIDRTLSNHYDGSSDDRPGGGSHPQARGKDCMPDAGHLGLTQHDPPSTLVWIEDRSRIVAYQPMSPVRESGYQSPHRVACFSPTTSKLIKQLVQHLAMQERCNQGQLDRDIFAVCSLHSNASRGHQADDATSGALYSPPNMLINPRGTIGRLEITGCLETAKEPQNEHKTQTRTHRRQISFQLGDDFESSALATNTGQRGSGSGPRKVSLTSLPSVQRLPRRDYSEVSFGSVRDSKSGYQTDSEKQIEFHTENTKPQKAHRAGSKRSILTAIRDPSIRSSYSPGSSNRLDNQFSHGSADKMETLKSARTAARTAGRRDSSERMTEKKSSNIVSSMK